MSKPFHPDRCVHSMHLSMCGMGVELKSDTPECMAEARRLFYGSAFNTPATSDPDVQCSIASNCIDPWIFAIETPGTLHVAKCHDTRPQAYEFYEWHSDGPRPVGESWLSAPEGTTQADADALMRTNYLRLRLAKTMLNHRVDANLRILHAAALEWEGKGLLALGGSHSGKSTLAISAALNGMRYFAEENAVVALNHGQLHPFPTPLRLRTGTLALSGLEDALIGSTAHDMSGDIRHLIDLGDIRPDVVGKKEVPLTHIVSLADRKPRAEMVALPPHEVIGDCIEAEVLPGNGDALRLFWEWAKLMPGIRVARLHAGPVDQTVDLLKRWMQENSREH